MSHRTNREGQQQTPRVVRDLRKVAEGWRDDALGAGVEHSGQSLHTAVAHRCHCLQPSGGEMVTCKGTWAHAVCPLTTPEMLGPHRRARALVLMFIFRVTYAVVTSEARVSDLPSRA